jgi:peptide/nickel transport system permease protein
LLAAAFISGQVVVEQVFAWPGIGRLAIDSVFAADFPVVAAVVILFTVAYVGMNLLVDLLYAVIDPRIRYT